MVEQSTTPFSFINHLYTLIKREVLRCEVSMVDRWVDLQVSVITKNPHMAQTTVLSVELGLEFRELSISDCWDTYYHPKPRPILHPLFCTELLSGTTHSYVHWTRLILNIGLNFWLWRQLLSTDQILSQSPTTCFRAELSSGPTHSSICCNILRLHRGVNYWLLR